MSSRRRCRRRYSSPSPTPGSSLSKTTAKVNAMMISRGAALLLYVAASLVPPLRGIGSCHGWIVGGAQQRRPVLYNRSQRATCSSSSSNNKNNKNNAYGRTLVAVGLAGSKSRNKQAELRRKLELAKRRQEPGGGGGGDEAAAAAAGTGEAKRVPSDEEIRERNDRLRFEELLKRGSSQALNDYSSDGYLNKQQEEEEIMAARTLTATAQALREVSPYFYHIFADIVVVSPPRFARNKQAPESIGSSKAIRPPPSASRNSCRSNRKTPSGNEERNGSYPG